MVQTDTSREISLTHPLLKSDLKGPCKTKYAVVSAIIASIASLLLGYNIGVMSGAQIFIKDDLDLTDTEIEILTGIMNLYSLAGSLTAGWTSDSIGRRNTLTLTAIIYFVGPLIISFSNNYFWIMVGRFVTGIGIGYSVIVPVYIAEVSPVTMRGFLTSLAELAVNIGLLLGYISNFLLADLSVHLSWRLMFTLGIVPAVTLGFGTLVMPESPRWLVMKGKLGKAQEVLTHLTASLEDAKTQLEEIKETAGIPKESTSEVVPVPKQSHDKSVWKELIMKPTPSVCRILITVLAIQFFQQASGIDTVVLYSPRVFEKAGMKSNSTLLGATMAVGLVKTISIPVAMILSDRVGRRSLLITGTAGMAASLVMLGLGLQIGDGSVMNQTWIVVVCIVAVLSYVSFFSIGIGPLTMAYSSEIMPLKLRAQGVALGMAMNRTVCGVVTMTFISLYEAITIAGSFYLYAGIAGMACAFVYICLPETKGKSLEEIEVLFGKKEKEIEGNGKSLGVAV
ncbi:Sugar transporter [Rhynchospora pubera]|uniref:Sugar transporter n=1 Tax=Rhynchospora pubera TaxID=906938 RepID=A0AAV8CJ47_9POAL|nr:Sugar transporter [Rhynchospora pubera]